MLGFFIVWVSFYSVHDAVLVSRRKSYGDESEGVNKKAAEESPQDNKTIKYALDVER